jgi:hypothetical protein
MKTRRRLVLAMGLATIVAGGGFVAASKPPGAAQE